MELGTLLNKLSVVQVIGEISKESVTGIHYDSRKVTKNSIFVAIKGFKTDGHKFIPEAMNCGALAIVLENDSAFPDAAITLQKTAKILVKDSRAALGELSNCFFGEPSKKLRLIGVTGTNGKTTTTYFMKSIFEEAGFKTGLIGTITNLIGDVEIAASLTTPESNDLNMLIKQMHQEACEYAVMEVSSHSLVLKRAHKLSFFTAVFTNLSQEHLDFHSNIDNYLNAKKILFDNLGSSSTAIYNVDNAYGHKIITDTKARTYSYGTSETSDFRLINIKFDLDGTNFTLKRGDQEYKILTSLVGDFNAYNATAAFAAAAQAGINSEDIIAGIKNTKQVPGRFEVIGYENKKIIIDYSHTPDSLEKALLAIRKIVKNDQPVYAVFGCGGNRDRSKRPAMGRIASELADQVIITSDNPRFEEPSKIIEEIKSGVLKSNYKIIESREEAIKHSVEASEYNAVILVAGKGHESYQEINGVRNHFSDKEVAEKYLLK